MDLSNCVIDVSSRCDLSLAARDTVELAFEKLTDKSLLDLSLATRDTVEPAIEQSQKNIVLNLICTFASFKPVRQNERCNRFDYRCRPDTTSSQSS